MIGYVSEGLTEWIAGTKMHRRRLQQRQKLSKHTMCWLNNWVMYWFIELFIDLMIDLMIDLLHDWSIDRLYDRRTDWMNTQACTGGVHSNKTNWASTGWTSVDRSTKVTLNTYNTWIQFSRLQRIYHFHWRKLNIIKLVINNTHNVNAARPILSLIMSQWQWWTTLLSQHGFRLRGVQSWSNRW